MSGDTARHPSAAWRAYRRAPEPGQPADSARFRERMAHPAFPRSARYDPVWVMTNLMGPNVLWLVEALAQALELRSGMRVLDMGCGTALSSIFLARELDVEVWAVDLWISPQENQRRIWEAGLAEQVYPLHAEGRAYPFQPDFFDVAVSVDAYHYWGRDAAQLDYVARFVKPGGAIGIVVPGAVAGSPVDDDPASPFHSDRWWRALWSRSASCSPESADMLPDGWGLWHRFLEASEAWSGVPVRDQSDAELLFGPDGGSYGFTRIVTRLP